MNAPFAHWTANCRCLLVIVSFALAPKFACSQALKLVQTEALISIYQDDQLVLSYNKVSPTAPQGIDPVYERSGFLHPVQTPSGRVITASFPLDHPHQQGIFSAWVKTTYDDRNVDFWNLASETGRVLHERVVSTETHADRAQFCVDLIHRAVEPPAVDVLRERWLVTVHATPSTHRCFDLELSQEALTSIPLEIHQHRYGGFAYRGPSDWLLPRDRDQRRLEPDKIDQNSQDKPCFFLNDSGSDRLKGNHEQANWVALSGGLQSGEASVIVLGHPDNFRAPQTVRIHPTKPYFVWAPCVDSSFQIDASHPYRARYRFLITDTAPDTAWIDEQLKAWTKD